MKKVNFCFCLFDQWLWRETRSLETEYSLLFIWCYLEKRRANISFIKNILSYLKCGSFGGINIICFNSGITLEERPLDFSGTLVNVGLSKVCVATSHNLFLAELVILQRVIQEIDESNIHRVYSWVTTFKSLDLFIFATYAMLGAYIFFKSLMSFSKETMATLKRLNACSRNDTFILH